MTKSNYKFKMKKVYLSIAGKKRFYLGDIRPSNVDLIADRIREAVPSIMFIDEAKAKRLPITGNCVEGLFKAQLCDYFSDYERKLHGRRIKAGIKAARSKINKKV